MGHGTRGKPSFQKEGVLNRPMEASLEVLGGPRGTRGESMTLANAQRVRGAMNKLGGRVESGSLTRCGKQKRQLLIRERPSHPQDVAVRRHPEGTASTPPRVGLSPPGSPLGRALWFLLLPSDPRVEL